jgi:hypothetical protein
MTKLPTTPEPGAVEPVNPDPKPGATEPANLIAEPGAAEPGALVPVNHAPPPVSTPCSAAHGSETPHPSRRGPG